GAIAIASTTGTTGTTGTKPSLQTYGRDAARRRPGRTGRGVFATGSLGRQREGAARLTSDGGARRGHRRSALRWLGARDRARPRGLGRPPRRPRHLSEHHDLHPR